MRNIVILGAGFAGVGTALELSKKISSGSDVQIILVDKKSCHTFTPALYEVATTYDPRINNDMAKEEKVVEEILCIPLREIFLERITIVKDEVENVDIDSRTIRLQSRVTLPFFCCVFALGLETNFFNVEGAREYALPIKTIPDAMRIRVCLQELMKGKTDKNRHIVVVGGGFTGVETVAELSCCVKKLCKDCGVSLDAIKLTLIEVQPTILAGSSEALIAKAEKRLQQLGVAIRTNTRTTKVTPHSIVLDSGEGLPADMVIWSTGVEAGEVLRNLQGVEKDAKGKIVVNEFLQALQSDSGQAAYENIFALGDNSSFIDPRTQKPAPATAFIAEQQAKIAAYNILQKLSGKAMRAYHPFSSIFVSTIGGKYAGTQIFGKTFTGFLPWIFRQMIDAKYFLSILSFSKAMGVIMRSEKVFTKND